MSRSTRSIMKASIGNREEMKRLDFIEKPLLRP
jgi:hypothetical protein